MKLNIEKEFIDRVPGYRAMIVEADVVNSETSAEQKAEMVSLAQDIASHYKVEDINKIPAIAATRAAYKACGKDPNRYRPSQEQLHRRIVRGLGLYNVNTLVDAGNQLSLITGCSVGCFDADKVQGDTLTLGIGRAEEPYEGIGRGPLNIEGLPVFRDSVGGIGTPTSDNERTKLELSTRRLLMTVHLFDTAVDADKTYALIQRIFTKYGEATNFNAKIYSSCGEIVAKDLF
jgi:DNA/RNA-binding domain of Phe-tRNA-synthetase-like protein